MSYLYLNVVLIFHCSIVAALTLQTDLQFLRDEVEQLKEVTDSVKANITSLEEINKELTNKLQYTDQKCTSKISAMQNDMQYLHLRSQNTSRVVDNLQQLSQNTSRVVDNLKQKSETTSRAVGNLQQKTNVVRAFTVQNEKAIEHVSNLQVIKFNKINTNEGGRYDTNTGVFTADIVGWYVFFFDIRVKYYKQLCWSELMKNNAAIVLTYDLSGSEYHQHSSESNMAVLHLQPNDHVWVRSRPDGNNGCTIDDHSSFSGFLLNAV